jgi:hypothetical protein
MAAVIISRVLPGIGVARRLIFEVAVGLVSSPIATAGAISSL